MIFLFVYFVVFFFFFKQKTAYEMRISDWSSDVCSSDLLASVVGALGLLRLGLEDRALLGRGVDRLRGTAATKRCELRLDVGLRAPRLELAGDVVLAAGVGDVIECAARDEPVDRTGTRLHVGGLVLGTLDGHADVAHLLADTGEPPVYLAMRPGTGGVGLD